eukprot:466796_1
MATSKAAARAQMFHRHTPLIYSHPVSCRINKPVYLKLDALQPSGSFKDRGIGKLLSHHRHTQGVNYAVSSSGGNAGLAVATVAHKMGIQCHVVVPMTTTQLSIDRIKSQNATVTQIGESWQDSDIFARNLLNEINENGRDKAVYAHPFDDPLIWDGHSTIIDELAYDFNEMKTNPNHPDHEQYFLNEKNNHCPSAIICSVGGGGLLNGLCVGLKNNSWNKHVTIVAAETYGADSFYQSFVEGECVTLDGITSIASSLGARRVQNNILDFVNNPEHCKECIPVRVSDSEAVSAILHFLTDHRLLVEPACSASLALLYNDKYVEEVLHPFENVVVEICGGTGINLKILQQYLAKFDIQSDKL